MGLPAGLRSTTSSASIAHQAVAQRRDLLGAERVLGPARAGTAATRARTPPIHQKGLITYDGVRKPAWADVQRWLHGDPAAHARRLRSNAAARRAAPGSTGVRVRTRRRPGSASLSWPERSRAVGLDRERQRDAAGGRGLRLVADAVVAAAAGVVLVVRGPRATRRRSAGTSGTGRRRERGPQGGGRRRSRAAPRRGTLVSGYPSRPAVQTPCSLPCSAARRVEYPCPRRPPRSWPTPRSSPSTPASLRARAPPAGSAARARCPASSTAATTSRRTSPSTRASCATRSRTRARSSTSRIDGGKASPVLVKDLQRHPVRGEIVHVDLAPREHERDDPHDGRARAGRRRRAPRASSRAACSPRRRASSTSRRCPATSRTRSRTTCRAWR